MIVLMSFSNSCISQNTLKQETVGEPKIFIETVCSFVVKKYKSEDSKKAVSILIGCNLKDLTNSSSYYNKHTKFAKSGALN